MNITFIFILLFCFPLSAQKEIELAARFFHSNHTPTMIPMSRSDNIPIIFEDQSLEQKVLTMNQGQEAVVKGHITYDSTTKDGSVQFRPVFLVQSIVPLSLKELAVDKVQLPEPTLALSSQQSFAPLAIPVTTEVASAITMTTALLLMQNLTASQDPQGSQQINQGMIIFAGALATGSFILDQFVGQKTSR